MNITYKKQTPEKGFKIAGDKVLAQKKIKYSQEINLSGAKLTATAKDGSKTYTLAGWSTLKDSKTVQYKLGEKVSKLTDKKNGKIVLYPVWQ